MSFSYMLLTPETEELYKKMLEKDRTGFEAWAAKGHRPELPFEKAYQAWLTTKGPVNFKTVDDSLRYKAELRRVIVDGR